MIDPTPDPRGSRRRRLWELNAHAHCPVLGVCLPMRTMRRLVDKVVGTASVASDYDLHCGVISECRQRGRLAEVMQRELDRRYALPVTQGSKAKTPDALMQWWRESMDGGDVAGALWSVITHPRCDAAVEEQVLRDIHMLQHQAGAAQRADVQRLQALMDENAVLARELGAAQSRSTQVARDQALRIEQLQSQTMQLRGELIGRDSALAALREQLRVQEDEGGPESKTRSELIRQAERQAARLLEAERSLLQARHDAERERRRADTALQALARPPDTPTMLVDEDRGVPRLDEHAVLCVGGRAASVPVYRRLIERTGGRFLHHDGGDQDSTAKLDATLAAADLVICQTGCISHEAYWRVKDHCKRTGKRCVFVEKPSRASLERALSKLVPAMGAVDELDASPPRRVIPLVVAPEGNE